MIVKNKKIKTLVCILGQTRAQDITWKNFNNFVLKSLHADLALCVAEKKTLKNSTLYILFLTFIKTSYKSLK